MVTSKTLAKACAKAASDQKADQVVVLDLRGISTLTDFMVVCCGNSRPHMGSILREVEADVKKWLGVNPEYRDGDVATQWVVLDFIDVMIHVMDEELRQHYGLEQLWKDAAIVEWEDWQPENEQASK